MKHQFYMFIFDKNTTNGPINEKDMLLMGETNIDVNIINYFAELSNKINDILRDFLIKNNIRHFIPLRKPTMEEHEDLITICYYHNSVMYDIIYSNYPEYVMVPIPPIYEKLEELYALHHLDGWYDARSNIIDPELL